MSRRRGTNRLRLWARRKRIYYRQSWLLAVKDLAKLTVAVGGVLLLVGATVGTGVAMIDATSDSAAELLKGDGSSGSIESQPAATPTDVAPNRLFNESKVARLVFEQVNHIRTEHGLNTLSYNQKLAVKADAHAEDMGRYDYLNHTSLDGETVRERYPFCPAGENIAQTWVLENIMIDAESEYYSNEKELANGLAKQWMNSPGHRENILLKQYASSGVGVSITPNGKVYAVQGFCAAR